MRFSSVLGLPSTLRLLLLLLAIMLVQDGLSFVLRPFSMPAVQRASHTFQSAVQVSRVTNPADAIEISEFFVTSFWDAPITKAKQKDQLKSEVYRDLTTRYIGKGGAGGGASAASARIPAATGMGKSALLVAKEGGKVIGCVGLETRVIREGQVTKFEVVGKGDAPGTSIGPVVANLAVDRMLRRKGIGKKILAECEKIVKGWGFQELWLVVDEKNKAARGLYEKNGYELVARDPRGMKVIPTEWQLKDYLEGDKGGSEGKCVRQLCW